MSKKPKITWSDLSTVLTHIYPYSTLGNLSSTTVGVKVTEDNKSGLDSNTKVTNNSIWFEWKFKGEGNRIHCIWLYHDSCVSQPGWSWAQPCCDMLQTRKFTAEATLCSYPAAAPKHAGNWNLHSCHIGMAQDVFTSVLVVLQHVSGNGWAEWAQKQPS